MEAGAFSESFQPKNHLYRARYPADYVARSAGDASMVISGTGMGGTSKNSVASLIGVVKPVTDDLDELARILVRALTDDKEGWTEAPRTRGMCHGEVGVRVDGTYRYAGTPSHVTGCVFFHHGHGYFFLADLPEARRARDLPALESILDATELDP